MDWTQRTGLLIGEQGLQKLAQSRVILVGLGGVGAYVAEFLVRAGLGSLVLVDGDVVQLSNINRQLPALRSSLDAYKTAVMARRLRDINPDIHLECFPVFLDEEEPYDLLYGLNRYRSEVSVQTEAGSTFDTQAAEAAGRHSPPCDFVVDAIDSLGAKTALIRSCLEEKMPFISSMGAAGKLDPAQIVTCDISKTHHCALARALRHRLGAVGIRTGFRVVFSPETAPPQSTCQKTRDKTVPGTLSYLPAAFACHLAAYTIQFLLSQNKA